jgi:poly(A) polymerase
MSSAKRNTALRLLKTLHQAGHQALFAGGCVRDKLRGVEPKDFDIATSATPAQIQALFPKTVPVGVQFGVVLVVADGDNFEIATFRTESGYQDGRRPSQVAFATLEEDAKRRDFTVNGLYWDGESESIVDLVGGQADLQRRIIRTIGDPDERFGEDHLRLLRAVRFAVQLDFEIEPETLASVRRNAARIAKVSQERIRDELAKILTSGAPARGIRLLDETGLLPEILPEIPPMKGVEQPPQYHPEGDVYVHTLLLLEQLQHASIELALAALLHDIAKPATFVRAPDRIRFNGHDKLGAEMTRTVLKRLVFPNQVIDLVCELVAEHLKFKDVFKMRVSTLKRFLYLERFDLHLELHRIDCMASHQNLDAYRFCQQKLAEFGAPPPPQARLVTGDDLKQLGYPPGPGFGEMLRAVEDAVLEGKVQTREQALELVAHRYPRGKAKL